MTRDVWRGFEPQRPRLLALGVLPKILYRNVVCVENGDAGSICFSYPWKNNRNFHLHLKILYGRGNDWNSIKDFFRDGYGIRADYLQHEILSESPDDSDNHSLPKSKFKHSQLCFFWKVYFLDSSRLTFLQGWGFHCQVISFHKNGTPGGTRTLKLQDENLATVTSLSTGALWRRVRDSNPQGLLYPNGFQDRPTTIITTLQL